MYSDAQKHFKTVDPVLYAASLLHKIPNIETSDDLFHDIVWTIIGQQLSSKAADTIFARFLGLFPQKTFTPKQVLKLDDVQMRTVGISGAKARAIKDLTRRVDSGELDVAGLVALEDQAVIDALTTVTGIGPWTAEMILMFSLGRTDIFSAGDLGLQKGLMHLYGLKKVPGKTTLARMTRAWSPYRTYAARILWRVADSMKKMPGKDKSQRRKDLQKK
jgi:DNA-3-methyladenine glycosylase II